MTFLRFSIHALSALLCLLVFGRSCPAQTPHERAQVDAFLKHWQQTKLLSDDELNQLRPLGKHALPLLAAYLSDKDLGLFAEAAMQQLDAEGATPYLLHNLAHKDPDVQDRAFRTDNRRILEYERSVRAGAPHPDPAQPLPRYPRNSRPYAYKSALHDAAIRCLTDDADPRPQAEAILSIGLTGSRRDIPLLKRYATKGNAILIEHSIAALARLGDPDARRKIVQALEKPVPSQPAQPFFRDTGRAVEPAPGSMVVPEADGKRLRTVMWQAAFTMDRRFVPLLIRHIDDPPGQFHGDYSDPSPAAEAMTALSQIVYGQEYGSHTLAEWKQWWREHETEYARLAVSGA